MVHQIFDEMKYKDKKPFNYFAKHGRFHEDFVPIEGDVLFDINTRFGDKNENPWTSNDYKIIIKNIAKRTAKILQ